MARRPSLRELDMIFTTPWKAWVLALFVFLAAAGFAALIKPLVGQRIPLLPFFPALVVVAFCAGRTQAIAVLLASLFSVVAWWLDPGGALHAPRSTNAIVVGLFVLAGGMVVAVSVRARVLVLQARQNRDRLQRALDAGRMVAWDWDVASGRVDFSEGARSVFGTTYSLLHEGWPLAHPDDVERVQGIIRTALREGASYSFVSRMLRADTGELRWIQTRGLVQRDEKGRPVHVSGITADVTQLRGAQEELKKEAQRKDAFLATLAHELRNPMAPIRYAVALLGDKATPAMREQARTIIARQSAHMARLLDDLLDMSRITRNAIELQRSVFDLRESARYAAENAQPAYQQSQHQLHVALPEAPVWVDGDPARLQQVLGNLLDNAAKYTNAGGEVWFSLACAGTEAVVRVRDNGIGIAPEHQAQVFELFSRLDTPGRGAGGLGIGLAVVRQLVNLHGGEVTVHSEGPGTGSEFTVRLPLAVAPAQTEAGDGKVVPLFQQQQTVLVVDDNRDTADTLATLLRGEGFTVSTAYDGAGALRAFDSVHPGVVLLDIGLPDMTGHAVAQEMRARAHGASTILVAITGWGQEKDRLATAQAGFDLHLVKPVDPQQLRQELAALLEKPRAA